MKDSEIFNESTLKDKEIREKLRETDYKIGRETREIYNKEEKDLKFFFSNLDKPSSEDPTLLRKKRYEEKMSSYKEVLDNLDFKNLIKKFWTYEPSTPEEIETMDLCRNYTRNKILFYTVLGVSITTFTSFYFRRDMTLPMKIATFGFGTIGGGIYGVINSTEFVLKRFEGLGAEFALGRLAITEIDEFRMDKIGLKRFTA